jgi:DNA gyrase inhibitor GyrI
VPAQATLSVTPSQQVTTTAIRSASSSISVGTTFGTLVNGQYAVSVNLANRADITSSVSFFWEQLSDSSATWTDKTDSAKTWTDKTDSAKTWTEKSDDTKP